MFGSAWSKTSKARARVWVFGLLAGVLAFAAMPAVAAAPADKAIPLARSTEDPTVQADAAHYYADHYRVSLATAYERLRIQDAAQSVIGQVPSAVGSTWAGAWYDPADNGRLKIGIASGKKALAAAGISTAKSILDTKGVGSYTDFVSVASSWNDLVAAQSRLDDQLGDLVKQGDVTTSITPDSNSVQVETARALPSSATTRVEAAATGSVKIAVTKTTADNVRSTFDSCATGKGRFTTNELHCDPPIRGGALIESPHTGCSAGFLVKSQNNGKPYLMTAGHCFYGQPHAVWKARFADNTTHTIGAGHSHKFPGSGDYALINIDNPTGWKVGPTAYVWVGASHQGITSENPLYKIDATGHSSVNMVVCVSAGTRVKYLNHHTDCGPVKALNQTVTDILDGRVVTVTGEVEAILCSNPGASGGPIYKSHKGYGLLSAQANGGGCKTYYQGLGNAEKGSHVVLP